MNNLLVKAYVAYLKDGDGYYRASNISFNKEALEEIVKTSHYYSPDIVEITISDKVVDLDDEIDKVTGFLYYYTKEGFREYFDKLPKDVRFATYIRDNIELLVFIHPNGDIEKTNVVVNDFNACDYREIVYDKIKSYYV